MGKIITIGREFGSGAERAGHAAAAASSPAGPADAVHFFRRGV